MSGDWIAYGFVAVAVIVLAIRVIVALRDGSFKAMRKDRHLADHGTGGGSGG